HARRQARPEAHRFRGPRVRHAGSDECRTRCRRRRMTDPTGGRELYVRHAKKDGRSVALLRAVDHGSACGVEAEGFPAGDGEARRPGPYVFVAAREATAFMTDAVETLMYLGCEVFAE